MDGKITYHQQVSFCGKPRCRRCREGIGHGPYWYAYRTVNGRTVRTYIGKEAPPEVLARSAEASGRASSEFANTQLRLYVLGQFRLEQRAAAPGATSAEKNNGAGNNPDAPVNGAAPLARVADTRAAGSRAVWSGAAGTSPQWEPVTDASLQHQRVRSLLICLVSSPGRKLAREQVMYMLWPELDMETAAHRLDRAVHSLRQVLEPGLSRPATSRLLLTEHSTLALTDQELLWVDADAFENLIARGRAALEQDPGQAEQLLEEAAQLYNGDFLPDEDEIEGVQHRREALRRSWIGLLLELADLRIAREAMPGAIEILDRLLAADPTNEAAVQRLVALLAQMGRRGEAIQAYQRFATALKQDFKIAPLAETRALFESVLRGNVAVNGVMPSQQSNAIEGRLIGSSPDLSGSRPQHERPPLGNTPERTATRAGATDGDKGNGQQAPDKSGQGTINRPSMTVGRQPPFSSGSLPAVLPAHMHIGRSHQSPLVGRDEEIARLGQLLQITEQARRLRLAGQKRSASLLAPLNLEAARRPQCVMLMGDVGIGKTRLAEEAAREAKRRGWAVAWCRAYTQESNVPYRLWTETLRKAMTQGLWQRQEVSKRPLIYQPLRSLLPELADLLPQSLQTMPPPPEQEQLRLWESTRALLSTISENTTLLIVLDDLQWADSSSCELLTYLVRHLREQPVMFLCTCRDTELPQGHHLRPLLTDLQREQAVEVVPVAPLSNTEIRELIAHLPEPVVESISARASGNPFFAEELARSVIDPDDPEELPGTIQAVLDLRLARITPKCLRILERAAVLGDAFQFDTIRDMASGGAPIDEDELLDWLEEAMQAGMLTEEGSGMQITYHFWHPLLLTYLYDSLSAARRASLHRRAGQVLQAVYAGREAEGAAEIAEHLVKGGGLAASIAHYAELAADRAYSLSAYPLAEKHYRLALEHLGPLSPSAPQGERLHRAYILERLGECTMITGKFEETWHFYEQVLEIRSKQLVFGSPEERQAEAQIEALIWCEISKAWRHLGNSEKARESFHQGENVLNEAGVAAGPAWAKLRYQQGHTLWLEGKLTEALAMANEALALVEALPAQPQKNGDFSPSTLTRRILNGDPMNLGRMYLLVGTLEGVSGQNTECVQHLNAALDIFEQYEYQREIAIVCSNLGNVYLIRAEYGLAQAVFQRALTISEKIGDMPTRSVALDNLGVLATRLGDLAEAEKWYRQALDIITQVNELFYISLFHSHVATALIEQGKLDESGPLLVQSLKISRAKHIAPCIGFALVALGQLHLSQALAALPPAPMASIGATRNGMGTRGLGGSERLLLRARATLRRALTFDGLEADTVLNGQLLLARIALLLGETENAQELAAKALEEATTSELVWLQAQAQCLLGQALAALGGVDAARAYFQHALTTFAATGMRLEHARASQAYAEALLRSSTEPALREQALRDLNEARQVFQECHADLDLRSVERLLAAHSEPATPATPARKQGKRGR